MKLRQSGVTLANQQDIFKHARHVMNRAIHFVVVFLALFIAQTVAVVAQQFGRGQDGRQRRPKFV